jgi:hypothetical protein
MPGDTSFLMLRFGGLDTDATTAHRLVLVRNWLPQLRAKLAK